MSEKRNIHLYIQDIFDCISKISKYSTPFSNGKELKSDTQAYEAVMMNFVIIGEAINNIYNEIKENFPQVEWKEVIAMRNILVHEYWGVDEKVVWDAIKNDLSELKNIILRIQKNIK